MGTLGKFILLCLASLVIIASHIHTTFDFSWIVHLNKHVEVVLSKQILLLKIFYTQFWLPKLRNFYHDRIFLVKIPQLETLQIKLRVHFHSWIPCLNTAQSNCRSKFPNFITLCYLNFWFDLGSKLKRGY